MNWLNRIRNEQSKTPEPFSIKYDFCNGEMHFQGESHGDVHFSSNPNVMFRQAGFLIAITRILERCKQSILDNYGYDFYRVASNLARFTVEGDKKKMDSANYNLKQIIQQLTVKEVNDMDRTTRILIEDELKQILQEDSTNVDESK